MGTSFIYLLLVVGYFAILFAISYVTGKDSSNDAFFLGKKQSPWYIVAFGMIGASLSGVTFISIPGVIGNVDALNGQFSYMQVALGYMLGYFIIATVLMPLYYRLNLTSIYSYLEQRFGIRSYKTGASFFLISRTIGAAFRLYLVAIALQLFIFDDMGVHFVLTVLFTLLLIWIYTLKGGIRTIVWTDTLQTTFMLLAMLASVWWIASELGLGLGGIVTAISESNYSTMFFWDYNEARFFPKQFFGGAAIAVAMTGLDQDMMQKNNSCKNIGEAQKNMYTFSAILLVVNLLFVSLGALLYLYVNAKGIDISALKTTDYLYPTLALDHFPMFLGVIFFIGLTAAAYSSADSALTALTTSFCVDFLDFKKKENSVAAKDLERTRYKVHIGFTFVLFFVILFFKYALSQDVITKLFVIATYTYGPLVGLFFFGIFVPKRQIKDKLAPAVCIVSVVLTYMLKNYLAPQLGDFQIGFELLIYNGLMTFVGLWLISEESE